MTEESEAKRQYVTNTELRADIASLQKKVDSICDVITRHADVAETRHQEVTKQIHDLDTRMSVVCNDIEHAESHTDKLEERMDGIERRFNVWSSVNSLIATIAGLLGTSLHVD